jgi:GT2 family glycosyltransferase
MGNTRGDARVTASDRISVAVTTFNAAADIAECLRALRRIEGVEIDDVIVVDNASTDDTCAIVEREFPEVRLIRLSENRGPCPARNVGLREAKNRLVFQVDSDVIVAPDCVAKLLTEMTATPDVAVASPRAVDAANRDVVHYDGGSFHYAGVMALRHFFKPRAECRAVTEDVDAFISLAAVVDRDALLRVGGYDETFFILFEDHDLSYRLRIAGYRIRSVFDALVDHRSGTAGISFRGGSRYPARRLWLHSRNRWLVVMKCYRWRTILVALPGVLLLGVAYVFFAWRQGALADYVEAKSSLIRSWPHIKAERAKIAAFRRARDRDLLGAPDLTFSPRIERGASAPLLERALSWVLRAWWTLARHFAG